EFRRVLFRSHSRPEHPWSIPLPDPGTFSQVTDVISCSEILDPFGPTREMLSLLAAASQSRSKLKFGLPPQISLEIVIILSSQSAGVICAESVKSPLYPVVNVT